MSGCKVRQAQLAQTNHKLNHLFKRKQIYGFQPTFPLTSVLERSASITNSTPLTSSEQTNPASNSALTKMVPEFEVIYIFHKYTYVRYLYKCKHISYGSQSCIYISLLWRKIFGSFQQTNSDDFQEQNLLRIVHICRSTGVHRFY